VEIDRVDRPADLDDFGGPSESEMEQPIQLVNEFRSVARQVSYFVRVRSEIVQLPAFTVRDVFPAATADGPSLALDPFRRGDDVIPGDPLSIYRPIGRDLLDKPR
jgi:hypothetical protein